MKFAGSTLAEQSGEDGHTAADYAGAHFGSTASCKKGVSSVRKIRYTCLKMYIGMENQVVSVMESSLTRYARLPMQHATLLQDILLN